jgi:hypothetical protein
MVRAPKGHRIGSPIKSLHHKFLPIPHLPEETEMLPAGPVSFGIEARIFATPGGEVMLRGASIHVFDAQTEEEWIRFDGFGPESHYHYLHPGPQTNELYGFDPAANGDFYEWAIRTLRTRMPAMLRQAGAERLAREVETQGFDVNALDRASAAVQRALERTQPGTDMAEPANRWHARWKATHPQFDTYGEDL